MQHAHFFRECTLAVLALLLAATAPLVAQEQHPLQKTSTLGKPIFPKLEYVNLNAELGFTSEMLRGFGARVDDARRSADADALAAQAVLLAFAEELAGRQAATVTSVMLLGEAVRIAEEQQNREAARAIAAAATRIPGSEPVVARMNAALALFAQNRGDGSFIGHVRFENKCDRILDAYVDGKYVGFLYDGEQASFSTGNGTTVARVVDAFGNTVSTVIYVKPDETFTWTIEP